MMATVDPATTAQPTYVSSGDDLASLIEASATRRTPLVDYGLAHAGLGHPPPESHIRFRQHSTLMDLYKSDFVVRAAAGLTLGNLQAALRPSGQFLPVDADDDLTLGELVLHNVYGPLRVGYGSWRDLLLGLGFVDGLGRKMHVGGRTVKNVAGYDVTRWMIGSLGELGFPFELILRTYAVPEEVVIVEFELSPQDHTLTALLNHQLASPAPAEISVTSHDGQTRLRIGYFGLTGQPTRRVSALLHHGNHDQRLRPTRVVTTNLWDDLAEKATLRAWRRTTSAVVKLVVPPAKTQHTINELRASKNTIVG